MKATGIVRRIDDLGRVVIPKEIRRTMRIREGDPLEIYTDKDGVVIFKKYSMMGELNNYAVGFTEVISKSCNAPVIITDRDMVIGATGIQKKDIVERRISDDLDKIIESRNVYTYSKNSSDKKIVCENVDKYRCSVAAPIIANGDVAGALVLLLNDSLTAPDESDIKLVCAAAQIIAKQFEE